MLTFLHFSAHKPGSDCISVSSCKNVFNFLIKPGLKSVDISSNKIVPKDIHKCSAYNSFPGVQNKWVLFCLKWVLFL